MAKQEKPIAAIDIPAAVEKIQRENAATGPKERPMTGVEIAAVLASEQPPAPAAGTQYRLTPFAGVEEEAVANPVIVASPDGTVEDAVRMYNAIEQRKKNGVVRTAKQLKIERLAS